MGQTVLVGRREGHYEGDTGKQQKRNRRRQSAKRKLQGHMGNRRSGVCQRVHICTTEPHTLRKSAGSEP